MSGCQEQASGPTVQQTEGCQSALGLKMVFKSSERKLQLKANKMLHLSK